jgi:hypothetical protein
MINSGEPPRGGEIEINRPTKRTNDFNKDRAVAIRSANRRTTLPNCHIGEGGQRTIPHSHWGREEEQMKRMEAS